MKKVLLTTTALTLMAGAAVAEVSVSGSARINVRNQQAVAASAGYVAANNVVNTPVTGTAAVLKAAITGGNLTTIANAQAANNAAVAALAAQTAPATGGAVIENRTRVNFKLSGQSDGGLTFGASTRLQTYGGTGGSVQGSNAWVSNGTMTLTVGNVSGAIAQVGGIYAVGGCGWSASSTYGNYCANVLSVFASPFQSSSSGGAGPQVVRLDFALGAMNVSASTTSKPGTGVSSNNEIAASYKMGAFGIALGSSVKAPVGAITGGTYATLSYSAGGIDVALTGVSYKGGLNVNGKSSAYILKAGMPLGGGMATAFVANDAGGNRSGVNYKYSLGGGATVIAAISNAKLALSGQRAGTTASVGLTFGF